MAARMSTVGSADSRAGLWSLPADCERRERQRQMKNDESSRSFSAASSRRPGRDHSPAREATPAHALGGSNDRLYVE